jgi:site-specific DNA-methyltransferase (adenine-specific)
MAHASEATTPLAIKHHTPRRLKELSDWQIEAPDVVLIELPIGRTVDDEDGKSPLRGRVREKCDSLPADSVLCVLTSAAEAAVLCPSLQEILRFQLWIAIKLDTPVDNGDSLPNHHAALLVFSNNDDSLRHTKTRIAYSYCPACDRTTKDYGGKKHTYNGYGTLMSDVWRDIAWDPGKRPEAIIARLANVFGLAPHRALHHVCLRQIRVLEQTTIKTPLPSLRGEVGRGEQHVATIESQLINADCLAALAKVNDNSIDFCFADPPYNLQKKYDRWNDGQDIIDYFSWCDQWLQEMARVVKPGATCAVLNIPLWAVRHFDCLRNELRFQSWIAWEALSLPIRMIMPAHYSIVCFSKGPPRALPGRQRTMHSPAEHAALTTLKETFCSRATCTRMRRREGMNDREPITDLWWDIHRLKHNSRRVDHPCQLPPRLMHRLIALFTNEGDTVLDPFNGAGTTSLCSEQLGRNYIGIEISADYHQIALQRHKALARGDDPFAKRPVVPTSKNSRVRRITKRRYQVPKRVLQLEVRALSKKLKRLPTRDDVIEHGEHPIEYFDEYFVSWGEVCAAARHDGMQESKTQRTV